MVTEQDMAALQRWARENGDAARAAVGLLIEHDHWLWNEEFETRCVGRNAGGTVYLKFAEMERFCDENPACSTSQGVILRAIADIGSYRWGIGTLDGRNRDRLVRAVATAAGTENGNG